MKTVMQGVVWVVLFGIGLAAHAGTVYLDYTDPQGNVLAVADTQGHILARYDYRPYGGVVSGGGPDGPGYTGHVQDPETGLIYMQARYDDPLGRFPSPDPVGPSPGNVYSFNRYAYADNNPIANIDPDGRSSTDDVCMGNMACEVSEGGDEDPYAGHFFVQDQIASAMQGSGAQDQQSASGSSSTVSSSHFSSKLIATIMATEILGGGPEDPVADVAAVVEAIGADSVEVLPTVAADVAAGSSEGVAEGGTYALRDAEGNVMRTGRTNNLARRELEHARDPNLKDFTFEVQQRTDVRSEQRGLEQMLHDKYSPPLNKINPISPTNPRLQEYMDAARGFLEK